MARPSRCRRICREPVYDLFSPLGTESGEQVLLSVDEYEVIRLIDFEKLTHEECAKRMDVARTTVTEMYEKARYKLADSIVNGKTLRITGGNYRLCDGTLILCGKRRCPWANAGLKPVKIVEKGAKEMRIAVTYEGGKVFQHFGHTEQFKFYDVENGTVVRTQVVPTLGRGHGALAGFLRERQVDALICGGIGQGAQNALAEAGIRLYGGVSGDADQAAQDLASGTLDFDSHAHCDHHEGEHGHVCGSHGEGCGH